MTSRGGTSGGRPDPLSFSAVQQRASRRRADDRAALPATLLAHVERQDDVERDLLEADQIDLLRRTPLSKTSKSAGARPRTGWPLSVSEHVGTRTASTFAENAAFCARTGTADAATTHGDDGRPSEPSASIAAGRERRTQSARVIRSSALRACAVLMSVHHGSSSSWRRTRARTLAGSRAVRRCRSPRRRASALNARCGDCARGAATQRPVRRTRRR